RSKVPSELVRSRISSLAPKPIGSKLMTTRSSLRSGRLPIPCNISKLPIRFIGILDNYLVYRRGYLACFRGKSRSAQETDARLNPMHIRGSRRFDRAPFQSKE